MCRPPLRIRSSCIVLTVMGLTLSLRPARADTVALLEALQQRNVRFPSFRIAWKVTQIEPDRPPMGHTTYEMLVDDDRFRIVRNVEGMADPISKSATSFTDTFADDGHVQYSFVDNFQEPGRTPTGNRSFNQAQGHRFSRNDNVLPMLLYFRPNAIRLHHFDVTHAKSTEAENNFVRIVAEAGRHDTLWQSTPPFALVRWEFIRPETASDTDQWTTTIEYGSASEVSADESDTVIPVAFKVTRSSPDGTLRWIKEGEVTGYSSRPQVSRDSFVIDYPEGTPVINGDNPDQKFVVRADKSFRPVSARDSSNYDTWLEMARAPVDPEVAHLDEGRSWFVYLLVTAAVAVTVFVFRYSRRSTV